MGPRSTRSVTSRPSAWRNHHVDFATCSRPGRPDDPEGVKAIRSALSICARISLRSDLGQFAKRGGKRGLVVIAIVELTG